jgi:hypothetical protein
MAAQRAAMEQARRAAVAAARWLDRERCRRAAASTRAERRRRGQRQRLRRPSRRGEAGARPRAARVGSRTWCTSHTRGLAVSVHSAHGMQRGRAEGIVCEPCGHGRRRHGQIERCGAGGLLLGAAAPATAAAAPLHPAALGGWRWCWRRQARCRKRRAPRGGVVNLRDRHIVVHLRSEERLSPRAKGEDGRSTR